MTAMGRLDILLIAALLSFMALPVNGQLDAWIRKATESVVGKPSEVAVDIPDCLVELRGGIDQVERTLLDEIDAGQRWVVLVTSSQDHLTAPAMMSYYGFVSEACSQPSSSSDRKHQSQSSEYIFEDSGDIKSSHRSKGLTDWRFAHLSFDTEPSLIWRWWIWKVPIILFISAPTQDQMPYDIRFWKIAFELPRKDRIKEIIEGGSWHNLAVWQSSIAPGGTLAAIPLYLGEWFGVVYNILDPLPSWLLTVLATAGGSLLISFLHSGQGQ